MAEGFLRFKRFSESSRFFIDYHSRLVLLTARAKPNFQLKLSTLKKSVRLRKPWGSANTTKTGKYGNSVLLKALVNIEYLEHRLTVRGALLKARFDNCPKLCRTTDYNYTCSWNHGAHRVLALSAF